MMRSLLGSLVSIPGVSGDERRIARRIASLTQGKVDRAGNVIVGSGDIMLTAHMDEVGFRYANGMLVPVGDVTVTDDLIGKGDYRWYERRFFFENGVVRAPALDNRVGCAVLVALGKIPGVVRCFTVGEETDGIGIRHAVRTLSPSLVICIDAAYARPDGKVEWKIPIMGKGPALQTVGKGFTSDLQDTVRRAAQRCVVSIQEECTPGGGGTDLSYIAQYRCTKVQINVPVRKQHTPYSQCSVEDIEDAITLLRAFIADLLSTSRIHRAPRFGSSRSIQGFCL